MMNLASYLRLVRLPNVFTALADILAGGAISRSWPSPGELGLGRAAPLLGASAALYMAGMAFNDIADREEDAEHRPGRPLPSGKVSLKGAVVCALVLMALGVGLTWWSGPAALVRGALLAGTILLYNFSSKKHPVTGPLVLGSCRFLNVQLGMTANPDFLFHAQNSNVFEWPWAPALAVGVYAAGLTAFSAQEERGKQARAILLGWLFCGAAILFSGLSGGKEAWLALAPLTLTLSFLTHRLRRLGTPEAARDLVRAGVMGICVLDAGLILGFVGLSAWPWAVGCVALLAPGLIIAKLLAQKEA
ncbi:MAG: UbiA family prenyltransferase [Planctomycetota bacterium]